MKKINLLLLFILVFCTQQVLAQCTTNFLNNPSFETPVQPNIGNNLTGLVTFGGGWSMTGGPFNVIKTDGTFYSGGPDNAKQGIQYVDITSAAGFILQSFTLTCPSTDIEFSGSFSSRESGTTAPWDGFIEILDASNTVVATSTKKTFTTADGAEDQIWYTVNGTATALPAGSYTYRVTLGDYGNFDDAFLCETTCPLPVKLTSFTSSINKCNVQLNWVIDIAINLKNYEIEYSTDGISFDAVGVINPIQNKSAYNFMHLPKTGKAYYRLKMIDLDNKYEYSKIINATVNCTSPVINIYPNPVTDFLHINLQNLSATNSYLNIYNATGKLLKSQVLNGASNQINIKSFASGNYYVTVSNNKTVFKYKIVKQ
jgi:Secretion system C-terminal sorting domain